MSSTTPQKGNTRVTGREQFYTPSDIAALVTQRTIELFPGLAGRLWIEPCGGSGKFLDAYAQAGITNVWSCDIDPQDPRVILRDFLSDPPTEEELPGTRGAVVVTNPPFGRNNSLSVPFFNTAALFADLIVFIVPRSWRKWSVQNRLDRHFWLVEDLDLGVNYEDRAQNKISKKGNLQTCVQVWERRDEMRPAVSVEDRGYITKTSPDQADISLTVFGRGCGSVKTVFAREKNTTQMFLSVSHPLVLTALNEADFSRFFRNVAYTEALSLPEINFLLNEWFDARPEAKSAAASPSR